MANELYINLPDDALTLLPTVSLAGAMSTSPLAASLDRSNLSATIVQPSVAAASDPSTLDGSITSSGINGDV